MKTENIYPQHQQVMYFHAKESDIQIINDLPDISVEDKKKYNKSKLVITDQWASHPSTEDRVNALRKLNIPSPDIDHSLAVNLLQKPEAIQGVLTAKLFENVKYEDKVSDLNLVQFKDDFAADYKKKSFSKLYNEYYNNKNPEVFDLNEAIHSTSGSQQETMESFFDAKNTDLVYTMVALENDLATLKSISEPGSRVKTFDYDGEKYSVKKLENLTTKLKPELSELKKEIGKNDIEIFRYFYSLALKAETPNEFVAYYKSFFRIHGQYESHMDHFVKMHESIHFIQYQLEIETIEEYFVKFRPVEQKFTEKLRAILADELYKKEVTPKMESNFKTYLADEKPYFQYGIYNDAKLEVLFVTLHDYQSVISQAYFNAKRDLLEYQVRLEERFAVKSNAGKNLESNQFQD